MKLNRTVQRSFEILEYISVRPNGVTLTQISKELDIPSSSVLDIVKTLYSMDCIYYKDENLKTYAIGSKMYAIGNRYTKNSILLEVSKPYVNDLSKKFKRPVVITKRVGKKLVYVYKTNDDNSIINLPEIGSSEDLHTTGLGKVLLAFSRKKDTLLKGKMGKNTPYTINNMIELNNDLENVIKNNYATSNREYHEHLKDLAVPIFNFENRVVGSIGVFFLTIEEIDEEIIK
jgi:DNA-binding IclR family transcriptional regulator